jgi:hypothetical protein
VSALRNVPSVTLIMERDRGPDRPKSTLKKLWPSAVLPVPR